MENLKVNEQSSSLHSERCLFWLNTFSVSEDEFCCLILTSAGFTGDKAPPMSPAGRSDAGHFCGVILQNGALFCSMPVPLVAITPRKPFGFPTKMTMLKLKTMLKCCLVNQGHFPELDSAEEPRSPRLTRDEEEIPFLPR